MAMRPGSCSGSLRTTAGTVVFPTDSAGVQGRPVCCSRDSDHPPSMTTGGRTQGSLAPLPRYLRHTPPVSGNCFLLDPLGLPPPLTASPPPVAPCDRNQPGAPFGASGTGRNIGHRHRWSSNEAQCFPPGSLYNLPGQRITGFPTADIEFRFDSARRSDSRRSRSSAPKSTYDMASASSRWPACPAMSRCISWATQR